MQPGQNIALKIPADAWESTVRFYRDIAKLKEIPLQNETSRAFDFGSMTLWVDKCDHLSQSEVWLELRTDSLDSAAEELKAPGVVRCDDIEKLPEGMRAFWIKSPGGIIHLITENEK
jgi:hypothetical protein